MCAINTENDEPTKINQQSKLLHPGHLKPENTHPKLNRSNDPYREFRTEDHITPAYYVQDRNAVLRV